MELKPYWKSVDSKTEYYVSKVGNREIVLAKIYHPSQWIGQYSVTMNNVDRVPTLFDSLKSAIEHVESRLSNNKKTWRNNQYCVNIGSETIVLAQYHNCRTHFLVYIGTSTSPMKFETEQEAVKFIESELGD